MVLALLHCRVALPAGYENAVFQMHEARAPKCMDRLKYAAGPQDFFRAYGVLVFRTEIGDAIEKIQVFDDAIRFFEKSANAAQQLN